MDPEVQHLLVQIDGIGKDLASGPRNDVAAKKKLRLAARKLSRALEEPGDIVERVCFSFMEEVSIRIALNLDIFNILVKRGRPQSLADLVSATGADPVLLARLLRSLASVGAVGEVGEVGAEAYVPTNTSHTFTIPPLAAGVEFCFDVLSPNWNNLPAYLAKNNYQNPTDAMNAAFHGAHNSKDHFIQFLGTKPDFQRAFQTYMSGFDEGRGSWSDFYPVEKELAAGAKQDPEAIMFVDIGGGMGHEAVALKKKFPNLPGKCVNQDLPQIIEGQKLEAGVESMAHDFFTPQPLKGARVYYLRYILHDWNDTLCKQILEHVRAAMDPSYSKILINQWVVPTQHASSFMTHQDLNMMATFSAMERTEQQMREMLEKAGLKLAHIWRPADAESECIIEAVVG